VPSSRHSRNSNQNWIHKKYLKSYEEEATDDQLKNIAIADELQIITGEYSKRLSKESKVAKDADLLDQIFLLKEYAWQGNREAELWLVDNNQIKLLSSDSAKKIAQEILSQKPSDWWSSEGWSTGRRK